MNIMVFPSDLFFRRSSKIFFNSAVFVFTAENSKKFAFVSFAIIRASVVLPEPGGPQNIMGKILPDFMALYKRLCSERMCF